MRVLKGIAAFIVIVLLFAAEAAAMGMFAIDQAFSDKTMQTAMEEQGSFGSVMSDELDDTGSGSGSVVQTILQSEAVDQFMDEYMSSAISSQLTGGQYGGVTEAELSNAFSSGIDEARADGNINISDSEAALLKQEVLQNATSLTSQLNGAASSQQGLSNLGGNGGIIDRIASYVIPDGSSQLTSSDFIKYALVVIAALLCLILIAMYWSSKAGLLWCTIITAIVSALYFVMMIAVEPVLGVSSSSGAYMQMVAYMAEAGLGMVSLAGFMIAAIFLVFFIISKLAGRKKKPAKTVASYGV